MSRNVISIDVSILGREYRIACPDNEKERLQQAAHLLDRKMREIRDSGKVSGAEKIAVMAALNITHDYISSRGAGIDPAELTARLAHIDAQLDSALSPQDNLL
jgi:cell division protein ZapA